MIVKFFDPFSNLARKANAENTGIYIGNCSEVIPKIKEGIQKMKQTKESVNENYR